MTLLTARLSLLFVVEHTLIIYLFLIFCFRYISRRQTSQLTFFELTAVMVLGSSVETAMVAGDTSLLAGLVSATVLFVCNRLLTDSLRRWRSVRRLLIGGPIILIHDGQILPTGLRRAGLTEAEVLAAIRERGFDDPKDLRYAVLEVDGSIGVIPMNRDVHRSKHSLRRTQSQQI